MAKRKSVKRTKRVRRTVHHRSTNTKRLNILLLLLALAVFALAAITMAGGGI